MGTFTISQVQPGQEVYLYPSEDGCVTDMQTSSGPTHYLLVDELKGAPDEDATYVYSDATSIVTDLYATAESVVSSLSGTINYIQVYARAKSHLYPQDVSGIYKILILMNPSECTDGNMYKSGDFDLTAGSYSNFNYVWSTNPSTSTAWQWADIENLEIGIQCSSPTLTNYLVSSTFRPNAVGDKTQLTAWSNDDGWAAINWETVDDINPDGNKSCVLRSKPYDGGSLATDLYNIPNHTTESGTIQKIAVFYVTNCQSGTDGEAGASIKIGGTEYHETVHDVSYEWTTYSYEWTTNPNTSVAWTWSDIDTLQIGVRLVNLEGWIQCTQVYMVVYYYADYNPEIRTTQCYAKINYDSEVTCTLNKPQEVSVDHNRNVKMLNFWSGNRAVYDTGRNKKTMVITGMQYGTNSCTEMKCIEGIAKFGGEITTNGLGGVFDDTFRIISFGWKKITDTPLTFEWILELEYSNLEENATEPEGI